MRLQQNGYRIQSGPKFIRPLRPLSLGHPSAVVVTLRHHSGIHNSTACLNAAKPRHTWSVLFSKGAVRRPHRLSFRSVSGPLGSFRITTNPPQDCCPATVIIPPPPPRYRALRVYALRQASAQAQQNKILISGTRGAFWSGKRGAAACGSRPRCRMAAEICPMLPTENTVSVDTALTSI